MKRVLAWLLLLTPAVALACELHRAQAIEKALAAARERAAPVEKGTLPTWVGPGYSGSWYDPARAGEGFTLEILEDGRAVVVWFTFPPAGSAARQAWILGQNGRVEANRIVFEDVYTARGARFGAGFDPDEVVLSRWGRLEFTFESCSQGSVSYAGAEGYGSGTHALQRLTTLDELSCAGTRRLTERGSRAASALRNYAGAFVDPSHAGEGWVIEPLSATQAGAYWFTYDGSGEAAWLLGIGTLEGNRLVIDGTLRPLGTQFGTGFDAARVERTSWGRVEFEFGSCNAATVRYASTAEGFGNGALNAQRLTRLASATCLEPEDLVPARASGTWREGPRMPVPESENTVALVDGRIYSSGGYQGHRSLLRLDPETGVWTSLPQMPDGRDHGLSVAHDRAFWIFGGFSGGQGEPGASWRFDPATNAYETLPATVAVGASAGAPLNGYFYLGNDDGSLTQYDPRTHAKREIPRFGPNIRDHSQVVAYLGEIWMLGGRELVNFQWATFNMVSIFDPVSETWRAGPSMRRPHSGFAAAVVDHQIVVAGGENLASLRVIPDVQVIAPGESVWTLAPPLPFPVHGFQAVAYDGEFWSIGGSPVAAVGGSNGVVQIYTPR
jgi:hypothetical protein